MCPSAGAHNVFDEMPQRGLLLDALRAHVFLKKISCSKRRHFRPAEKKNENIQYNGHSNAPRPWKI